LRVFLNRSTGTTSLILSTAQYRAVRIARMLPRPNLEGTRGLSNKSSCFGKLALTNGSGEDASCRFAARTYGVRAGRIRLIAIVQRFGHLRGAARQAPGL